MAPDVVRGQWLRQFQHQVVDDDVVEPADVRMGHQDAAEDAGRRVARADVEVDIAFTLKGKSPKLDWPVDNLNEKVVGSHLATILGWAAVVAQQ